MTSLTGPLRTQVPWRSPSPAGGYGLAGPPRDGNFLTATRQRSWGLKAAQTGSGLYSWGAQSEGVNHDTLGLGADSSGLCWWPNLQVALWTKPPLLSSLAFGCPQAFPVDLRTLQNQPLVLPYV